VVWVIREAYSLQVQTLSFLCSHSIVTLFLLFLTNAYTNFFIIG